LAGESKKPVHTTNNSFFSIFRYHPFLRLVIAFIAGLLCSYYFPHYFKTSIVALSVFVLLLVIIHFFSAQYYKSKFKLLIIQMLFIMLGATTCYLQLQKVKKSALPQSYHYYLFKIAEVNKKTGQLTGTILNRIENDNIKPLNAKCISYIRKSEHKIQTNDYLLIHAKATEIKNSEDPLAFDYKKYLFNKGIIQQLRIDSFVILKYKSLSIFDKLNHARHKIMELLEKNGKSTQQISIISAITMGIQSTMEDSLKESFVKTGTAHILSVSGLHVGIIYLVLGFFINPFKKNKSIYLLLNIIIILVLFSFAIFTGLSPSVTRATTMFSFLILGNVFSRKYGIINSLSCSALLILFVNPTTFFDIGFQLSYSAVIGIAVFYKILNECYQSKFFIIRNVWSLFSLSLAAQITTFPLSMYYFHNFSFISPVANIIIVPLVSLIMPVSILFLILIKVELLSNILNITSNLSIQFMEYINHFFSSFKYSSTNTIYIDFPELIIIYLMVLSLGLLLHQKKYFYVNLIFLLLIVQSSYRNCRFVETYKTYAIVKLKNNKETYQAIRKNNRIFVEKSAQLSDKQKQTIKIIGCKLVEE